MYSYLCQTMAKLTINLYAFLNFIRQLSKKKCQKNVKRLFIVAMHLATPSQFTDMPLKLKETNISNEHNRLKNPNWRQTSWLFTSMTEELNQGPPRNNSSLVVRAGLEPVTSRFQVRRPNHSATLPPSLPFKQYKSIFHFCHRNEDCG